MSATDCTAAQPDVLAINKGSTPSRICKGLCALAKPNSEFYPKENGRRDSVCIECRKQLRRSKYVKTRGATESTDKPIAVSKPAETPIISVQNEIIPNPYIEILTEIAEALLLLERWKEDLDTQGEISNQK